MLKQFIKLVEKPFVVAISIFIITPMVHAQDYNKIITTLHTTEKTKVISIKDVKHLYLSPAAGGYFVAIQSSGEALIFDNDGNIKGKISNCCAKDIVFEDGQHALASLNKPVVGHFDLGIINTRGEIEKIVVSDVNNSSFRFIDGIGRYYKYPKDYYFDTTGKITFILEGGLYNGSGHSPVLGICDGLRPIENKEYRTAFYDKSWKLVIPFDKGAVSSFSEGLAVIKKVEGNSITYGYIDKNGNIAIEPKFSNKPGLFHDGYALVKKSSGNYCFINKVGQQCSPEYKRAEEFNNGVALVWPIEDFKYGKPAIIIDKEFKQQGTSEYYGALINHVRECSTITGQDMVYSNTGKKIIKAGGLHLSTNGIISFRYHKDKQDFKGYANLSNEIIVLFKEDEF